MHLMQEKTISWKTNGDSRPSTLVHPGNSVLRRAIRSNIVTFPSQIPAFLKQPSADMQWRVVLLFFVRGWSSAEIARRFDIPRHRISEILNDWSIRALALGYVQVIDAEAFASCCRTDAEFWTKADVPEIRRSGVGAVLGNVPQAFPDEARNVVPDAGLPLAETKSERKLVGPPGQIADFISGLDVSIAHCEEWRGEFWERAATLLRDLRMLGARALEFRRSSEQTDGLFTTSTREEEHASHAVV